MRKLWTKGTGSTWAGPSLGQNEGLGRDGETWRTHDASLVSLSGADGTRTEFTFPALPMHYEPRSINVTPRSAAAAREHFIHFQDNRIKVTFAVAPLADAELLFSSDVWQ